MARWETYLNGHRDRFIDELLEFLRIPSISSLPDHISCLQAAIL
jgi:hypothetical protein